MHTYIKQEKLKEYVHNEMHILKEVRHGVDEIVDYIMLEPSSDGLVEIYQDGDDCISFSNSTAIEITIQRSYHGYSARLWSDTRGFDSLEFESDDITVEDFLTKVDDLKQLALSWIK